MTYLDTHIVVWLYRGDVELLSRNAREQVQNDDLLVSPAVVLELEYLKEIERLRVSGGDDRVKPGAPLCQVQGEASLSVV